MNNQNDMYNQSVAASGGFATGETDPEASSVLREAAGGQSSNRTEGIADGEQSAIRAAGNASGEPVKQRPTIRELTVDRLFKRREGGDKIMPSSQPVTDIRKIVLHQLASFWPYPCPAISDEIVKLAVSRTQECLFKAENKLLDVVDGATIINPLHSGQYSIFLYYLANTLRTEQREASMLYSLNKILHGVDWYFDIDLPAYWSVEHPVGSVLGRAVYGEGFHIYQGCTVVGANVDGVVSNPILGKNVYMCAHSSIIGKCNIGDDVYVGPGCLIRNQDVPDRSIVTGQSPNLVIKSKDAPVQAEEVEE